MVKVHSQSLTHGRFAEQQHRKSDDKGINIILAALTRAFSFSILAARQ